MPRSLPAFCSASALSAFPASPSPSRPSRWAPPTTHVPAQPSSMVLADGSLVGAGNPLPTRDLNGAAVGGFVPISGLGVTVTAGRGIARGLQRRRAGELRGPDGSTLSVPLNAGFNQFGFAVVQVQAGATATCTYTNLK